MPPRILTFCEGYWPGYRAGGPLRSIAGLVRHLGHDFEFWVLTRDRDLGERAPYADVARSRWTEQRGARVYYARPEELTPSGIRRIAATAAPDLYYVNSLFARRFSMIPLALRRAGLVPARPCVLAPRGELLDGALAVKPRRKRAFLAVARRLPLYRDVIWQASSPAEAAAVRAWFPAAHVLVAENLADGPVADAATARAPKRPGAASLVFASRIAANKGLDAALRALRRVRGEVAYHIYGAAEDEAYGRACRAEAARLPSNVRVTWHGAVSAPAVAAALPRHHALLLPTRGENFGHAILEALLAGCVAIIGDRTPWRGLAQRGAGWDLPATDEAALAAAVQRTIDMDAPAFAAASAAARSLGAERAAGAIAIAANRRLFHDAVGAS